MQSRKAGVAVLVIGVIAAVVLFVVLNGDDGGSSSSDDVATIVIKGGQPVGGVQDLTFTEGGEIRFIVRSDVSDEVHFHGYDVGKDVEAGGQVSFDVPATISGVFEVELENRVVPIASITVNPS